MCCAAGPAPAPAVNGHSNPAKAQWTDFNVQSAQFSSGVFGRYYDCSVGATRPARVASAVVVDADLASLGSGGLSLAFMRAAQADIAVSLGVPQRRVYVTGLRPHDANASGGDEAADARPPHGDDFVRIGVRSIRYGARAVGAARARVVVTFEQATTSAEAASAQARVRSAVAGRGIGTLAMTQVWIQHAGPTDAGPLRVDYALTGEQPSSIVDVDGAEMRESISVESATARAAVPYLAAAAALCAAFLFPALT